MSHLERRRQLWYATLTIPVELRGDFGKFKFIQSLGTPDKREAEIISAPIIAGWKTEIRKARGQTSSSHFDALRWKRELDNNDNKDAVEDALIEVTKKMEAIKGAQVAHDFFEIATGSKTPSDTLLDQWKKQIALAPKTKDQMVKDVDLLVARFSTLEGITKQGIKTWMDDMGKKNKGLSSQRRILSFCQNYWKYLQSHDAIPAELNPFTGVLSLSKTKKAAGGGSWLPLTPEEVVTLYKGAQEKNDDQLRDLIILGAYTGARIEELCSLKINDVTKGAFRITDAKTAAGVREVPIHSKLTDLVAKLKKASKDDYLLSGLTFNKYNDRSNAVGKRFGRLKVELGFTSAYVFHSIRKTFTTQLENTGTSENLAADIVGHEKPRITYGLYSGGATLEGKREAIEKVEYPFQTNGR
jgi:integrase